MSFLGLEIQFFFNIIDAFLFEVYFFHLYKWFLPGSHNLNFQIKDAKFIFEKLFEFRILKFEIRNLKFKNLFLHFTSLSSREKTEKAKEKKRETSSNRLTP